jgi:beta-ureidopropionase / N-carbamoyl-L-amino-acid hydrolase
VKGARQFDADDAADAESLFAEIRRQSDGGPYHPGVTRPSYSVAETNALRTLQMFAHDSRLAIHDDAAANLWFELPRFEPTYIPPGPAIWIGSHVDSVPSGGNYDGLAGVVAGLLCLRKIRRSGVELPQRVCVAALRGEESAWFGIPYIGAKALLGQITHADLDRTSRDGVTLRESMHNCGAQVGSIERGVPCVFPQAIKEYWELHIEQGPVLVNEEKPVGIVTGIRGNVRYTKVRIVGQEGHSGTVPRDLRRDAVFAFAEFVSMIDDHWDYAVERGNDLVVTCGIVETDANVHGITRIPGSVSFCLEARSLHHDTLDKFQKVVDATIRAVERDRRVQFVFDDPPVRTAAAHLAQALAIRAAGACAALGLPERLMPSGAGHDAAIFANAGIPTGMIFVRNANGSHNPDEAMEIEDFMLGVEILYNVVTKGAP